MNIEVLQRPPAEIVVELGDTVSLACSAHGHGNSDPLVYWVKGVGVRHGKIQYASLILTLTICVYYYMFIVIFQIRSRAGGFQ